MKTIFVAMILTLLSLSVYPQAKLEKDTETGLLKLEQIKDVDSLPKTIIYEKVKIWIAETFKDPSKVITSDSPNSGTITLRYVDRYSIAGVDFNFYNIMKIYIKDGKYKAIITSIENPPYTLESYVLKKDGTFRTSQSTLISDVESRANKTFDSLNKFISKKEDSNW